MFQRAITLFPLFLLCVSVAAAQDGPLSEGRINAFMASMLDLEAWGDAHEDDIEDLDDLFSEQAMSGDFTNPFAAATRIIESQSWAGEVKDIIRSHGFDGLEDWARTGNRIFMAYMAVQMDANKSEMDAGMAEALKQIENSGMSEDEKERMRQMLQGANQMASMYAEVPAADKKAVIPFLDALENMGTSEPTDE